MLPVEPDVLTMMTLLDTLFNEKFLTSGSRGVVFLSSSSLYLSSLKLTEFLLNVGFLASKCIHQQFISNFACVARISVHFKQL